MNTPRPPSIIEIIRGDYLALMVTVTPLMVWLLLWVVYILPAWLNGYPVQVPGFLWLALIGLSLICLAALVWRIQMIQSVFANGTVVDGVITRIWFVRDRGRFESQYTHQGTRYTVSNAIIKNNRTRVLKEGALVRLVVDPDDPKRVFLPAQYF